MSYETASTAGAEDIVERIDDAAETPRKRQTPVRRRSFARLLRPSVVALQFAVYLAVWEVAVGTFELVSPIFLPPPSRIASGLVSLFATGEIYPEMRLSFYEWGIGYLIAVVIGIAAGIALASSRVFAKLGGPVIWTIYAAPYIAFQPLFVVWFGFGSMPVIFLVASAAVFPILFNTAGGIQTVDDALVNAGRVFGASRKQILTRIVFPSIGPFILVGLRHGVVNGSLALLIGQMTGSTNGLGAMMVRKTAQFQTGSAYAIILLTVVFATVMGQSLHFLNRRLAPWQADA